MITIDKQSSATAEYDERYRVWLERQGPHARDRDWRPRRLPWRDRLLFRHYRVEGKRVIRASALSVGQGFVSGNTVEPHSKPASRHKDAGFAVRLRSQAAESSGRTLIA
jgi:hypothetical protein